MQTHMLTTQQHVFQTTYAKCRSLQLNHYLAISNNRWEPRFWTILSDYYGVSVGLYCLPLEKGSFVTKDIKKKVWKQTDQESQVAITDAIS